MSKSNFAKAISLATPLPTSVIDYIIIPYLTSSFVPDKLLKKQFNKVLVDILFKNGTCKCMWCGSFRCKWSLEHMECSNYIPESTEKTEEELFILWGILPETAEITVQKILNKDKTIYKHNC